MYDPKLMPGTRHCKCASCGEYFTNENNFAAHRRGKPGSRVCVNPGTLRNKHGKARFHRNAKGLWARTGGVYIGDD